MADNFERCFFACPLSELYSQNNFAIKGMYCIFILPIVKMHIQKPRRHWENKKIIPYPQCLRGKGRNTSRCIWPPNYYGNGCQRIDNATAIEINSAAIAAKITLISVVSVIVINCVGRFLKTSSNSLALAAR